jgi:SAM-dependent methyltransferase
MGRELVGVYYERLSQVVLKRPEARRILAGARMYCNHGHGPFDSLTSALCYCVCQAPMHYESFYNALDRHFGEHDPFPRAPLVVDLGCGPATTLMALGDWLIARRGGPSTISYIGIDTARPFRDIAESMLDKSGLFAKSSRFRFSESEDELADHDIERSAKDRDGVIFALSYIVHQRAMQDMSLLGTLMARVRAQTGGLPTWFLLQDANFADMPDGHTEIWPENRLNRLANRCRSMGYEIRANRAAKKTSCEPRVLISQRGEVEIAEPGATQNVCFFFQKIA